MIDKIQQEINKEARIKRQEVHEQRHKHFKSLVDKYNIDLNVIRIKLKWNFELSRLEGFYNGTIYISQEGTYNKLIKIIESLVEEKPKHEVVSKIQLAILQRNGNLLLGKSIKKNLDELKSILNHLAIDYRVIKQKDGCYIVEDKKVFKTQFAKGKVI